MHCLCISTVDSHFNGLSAESREVCWSVSSGPVELLGLSAYCEMAEVANGITDWPCLLVRISCPYCVLWPNETYHQISGVPTKTHMCPQTTVHGICFVLFSRSICWARNTATYVFPEAPRAKKVTLWTSCDTRVIFVEVEIEAAEALQRNVSKDEPELWSKYEHQVQQLNTHRDTCHYPSLCPTWDTSTITRGHIRSHRHFQHRIAKVLFHAHPNSNTSMNWLSDL